MIPIALRDVLRDLGSLAVAYSGGVDSTYLAWVSHLVLADRSLAVLADSASLPRAELADALEVAQEAGFPVEVVHPDEFTRTEYLRNDADRCFHCKQALFDVVFPLAAERGLDHVALGTVTDDLGDTRPGLTAARRRGAVQPLLDAGLDKQTVRRLARDAGLRVWDKPQAACLSSRIPHGTPVDAKTLHRIERAEEAVRSLGFRQVRVRHHGERARIEVGTDQLAHAEALRSHVVEAVLACGYRVAEIDPRGYRTGGRSLPVTTR